MKQILFVDDDTAFLELFSQWFAQMSAGKWKVFTASTHGRALQLLNSERMDLLVLDIGMPVMDGMQFLRLVLRAHPGQQIVMLTGQATEERKKACLEQGAAMLLEKPVTPDGYQSVFAVLESLGETHSKPGFRGVTREVGLQEVLRMDCLARKSSIVEVFTPHARGLIFISEGEIVHAEAGSLQGEAALYGLLGFVGAEFNLREYNRPMRRTIFTKWESLLTEAAQMQDEHSRLERRSETVPENAASPSSVPPIGGQLKHQVAEIPAVETLAAHAQEPDPPAPSEESQVRIAELVLCSGAGEMLFESRCVSVEARLQLLAQVEEHAAQLSGILPAGRFDRVEAMLPDGRAVVQIAPDRRLLVRSVHPRAEGL
jgi:CheY-like chemotaxis protein